MIVVSSATNAYFTTADSEAETTLMSSAKVRPASSICGQRAGIPIECPEDENIPGGAVEKRPGQFSLSWIDGLRTRCTNNRHTDRRAVRDYSQRGRSRPSCDVAFTASGRVADDASVREAEHREHSDRFRQALAGKLAQRFDHCLPLDFAGDRLRDAAVRRTSGRGGSRRTGPGARQKPANRSFAYPRNPASASFHEPRRCAERGGSAGCGQERPR